MEVFAGSLSWHMALKVKKCRQKSFKEELKVINNIFIKGKIIGVVVLTSSL